MNISIIGKTQIHLIGFSMARINQEHSRACVVRLRVRMGLSASKPAAEMKLACCSKQHAEQERCGRIK